MKRCVPVNEIQYPGWQKVYRAAVQEFDVDKLPELVTKAEAAIFMRLQELSVAPDGKEEQALQEACKTLLTIKTGRLGWPWLSDGRQESRGNAEPE